MEEYGSFRQKSPTWCAKHDEEYTFGQKSVKTRWWWCMPLI